MWRSSRTRKACAFVVGCATMPDRRPKQQRGRMAATVQLLERGVWKADYLLAGCEVLLAIDRHGNCVRRVRLTSDVDELVARAWLEGYVERVDPEPRRPQLLLVRPTPSSARIHPAAALWQLSRQRDANRAPAVSVASDARGVVVRRSTEGNPEARWRSGVSGRPTRPDRSEPPSPGR